MWEQFAIKLFITLGEYLFSKGILMAENYIELKKEIERAKVYSQKVNEGGSREDRRKAEDDFFS